MDFGPSYNLTLSPRLVQQWTARQGELGAEIIARQEEINEIQKKLDAARILAPALFEQMEARQGTSIAAPSLTEAIVEFLESQSDSGYEPRDIRLALERKGILSAGQSKNYFYTALKRAVDRNRIRNDDGRYSSLFAESPKGETGGVAPPASVSTSSQSEEAVSSGSKGEWGT